MLAVEDVLEVAKKVAADLVEVTAEMLKRLLALLGKFEIVDCFVESWQI